MTEKKKKTEEGLEIDFGVGTISLRGLFRGIEKLVDLADNLKEAGGEIRDEKEIDLSHLKEGMKGILGFSVRTALGGKSVVEPFGNIKKTTEGSIKVEEERDPITDVFDEKNEILVISEIPGVDEEGISITAKGDILEISAVSKNRNYHKEILLPVAVRQENITHTYRSGVLEIRIKK